MPGPERELQGRGYWGRILWVDLSRGEIAREEVPGEVYRRYLSGIGLAAKILWDRLPAGTGALDPENILGLTTGLLTDTGALFAGRFTAVGLSPQTGGWGDANCGGYFAPALKRCGLDAVFITGAAERPVYLFVNEEEARLEEAAGLWGQDLVRTEEELRKLHGPKARAVCIGPAGERLSWLAGIGTDRGRLAARSGLGAVMGSKNLKAVVAAGSRRVGTADQTGLRSLSRSFKTRLDGGRGLGRFLGDGFLGLLGRFSRRGGLQPRQPSLLWRQVLAKYGTSGVTALSAEVGDSPVRNWTGVGYRDFPLSVSQRIGAEAVLARQVKRYGCASCPLRCGGIVELEDGRGGRVEVHKPEYETLAAFGSLVLNHDLEAIIRLNDLVNRAGMDSISCGAAAAFAVECFEEGLINREDTGGLTLAWGEPQGLIRLTEMIIRREGIGDLLADGVARAAAAIGQGAERLAVHCGGVEPPMHDPKYDPGYGLAYCCEPTPGRHTITAYQLQDLQHLEEQFSRAARVPALTTQRKKYQLQGKAGGLAVTSFYKMLVDAAGVCLFGTQVGAGMPLGEWMNAATGWNLTNDEYLVIGERIHQLRHAFNFRQGINPIRDFKPHPRLLGRPPLEKGPLKGISLDLEAMAAEYYQVMGWDRTDGSPSGERLAELGLEEILEELNQKIS